MKISQLNWGMLKLGKVGGISTLKGYYYQSKFSQKLFSLILKFPGRNIKNPCDTPILRKIFKDRRPPPWPNIEKELIDEIIFKTVNPRNRIMLELMARGGMRIGEVLIIRPIDIQDRKITLPDPKSGKEFELVFIPQKVADRLKEYIKDSYLVTPYNYIFSISRPPSIAATD